MDYQEYNNQVADRAWQDTQDRYWVNSKLPAGCPWCSSMDGGGMLSLDREQVDRGDLTGLYRWPGGNDHVVYMHCPECGTPRRSPEGYVRLHPDEVRAWIDRPCECHECHHDSSWDDSWLEMAYEDRCYIED